jgi:hypothetical protein
MVDKGVKIPKAKKLWNGADALKNIFDDFGGKTKLHAEVQVEKEWQDHMNTGFTKGLMVVKSLAEGVNLSSV